jgi:hypothetical protein
MGIVETIDTLKKHKALFHLGIPGVGCFNFYEATAGQAPECRT